jgi:hypothetical protein
VRVDDRATAAGSDCSRGERASAGSKDEVLATSDTKRTNRGLSFDVEMVLHGGCRYHVARRAKRTVDERMIRLLGECVIRDDVRCPGLFSGNRLVCTTNIVPYWREIWLERVDRAPCC